jgi:predicted phosphodiesterase
MGYKYEHLIKNNIAPAGAKRIGIYEKFEKIVNNKTVITYEKKFDMPLGNLKPHTGTKKYTVGLISDSHISGTPTNYCGTEKFNNALTYIDNAKCDFCVLSGDITNIGFYTEVTTNGVKELVYYETQFQSFKNMCDSHKTPVYELAGNHESYNNQSITNNRDAYRSFTHNDILEATNAENKFHMSYILDENIVEKLGDDVFILVGQNHGSWVMSNYDFKWLLGVLEENRNKRCFVFIHSHMNNDSGNATQVRGNSIFGYWTANNKPNLFMKMMAHYKNTILFHGHTHLKFNNQELDENANYTTINGFRSVHIPSSGAPRDIVNGSAIEDNNASQFYILDVYDNCIVLNGINNTGVNSPVSNYEALGTYKIDTTLQNVAENTFEYADKIKALPTDA